MLTFELKVPPDANVDHAMFDVIIDGQRGGMILTGFADVKWYWSIDPRLRGNLGLDGYGGPLPTREEACEAFKEAWAKLPLR